jgi:hypothetical protein
MIVRRGGMWAGMCAETDKSATAEAKEAVPRCEMSVSSSKNFAEALTVRMMTESG